MVHKKFIKKGDKTYGPYYYESYRENGRVKKRYIRQDSFIEEVEESEKDLFERKKAVASTVVLSLLILVGISAVILIGIFAFSFFEEQNIQTRIDALSIPLEIKHSTVEKLNGPAYLFNIVVGFGNGAEDISGLRFVFMNSSGNSFIIDRNVSVQSLETKQFDIPLLKEELNNPSDVKIAFIMNSENKLYVSDIKTERKTDLIEEELVTISSSENGELLCNPIRAGEDVECFKDAGEINSDSNISIILPGPTAEEISNGSEIIVKISSEEEGYEDVLSYASIPEVLKVGEENNIVLYWRENDSYISFEAFDLDGNGFLDYIEWITPHLSEQTFEIILITRAQLLNDKREYIKDVYDSVRTKDDVFAEVSDGNYLRVRFEKNLSSEKDITLYARGNGNVKVYEKDKNDEIADFGTINDYDKYRVLLSNLEGEQDTFDLLVSGNIEFDYVVDPIGDTNNWICATGTKLFSDSSCWSLGTAPVTGENVVIDSGNAVINVTRNSMPQYLASFRVGTGYTGTIHFNGLFAQGNWGLNQGSQEWNVTGGIDIQRGTLKIYGDYPFNITSDGRGQKWISLNGNISIGSQAVLDGFGLGFPSSRGPGFIGATGGYGGRGGGPNQNGPTYGSEENPLSLGSGGLLGAGGSGIYLESLNGEIKIDGTISMSGFGAWAGGPSSRGSGGSLFLKAERITGSGSLYANGGYIVNSGVNVFNQRGGGGGRIAIIGTEDISFNGAISVLGGDVQASPADMGSGGTLFISSPNNILTSGNLNTYGYKGGYINVSGNYLDLSGSYNSAGLVLNGANTLRYDSCSSVLLASFSPPYINALGNPDCSSLGLFNVSFIKPINGSNFNFSYLEFDVSTSSVAGQCLVSIDGNTPIQMVLKPDKRGAQYYTNVDEGFHSAVSSCTDTLGASGSSQSYFNVDLSNPEITINYPEISQQHFSENILLNVSASDSVSGVQKCEYSLDGSSFVLMNTSNNLSFVYLYNGITHGLHDLDVRCKDNSGNTGIATLQDFEVNLIDFSVVDIIFPNPVYSNGSLIGVNVSNNGPVSGSGVNVGCYVDGELVDSQTISLIAGNENRVAECDITVQKGAHTFTARVDYDGQFVESNESNNLLIENFNSYNALNIGHQIIESYSGSEANYSLKLNLSDLFNGNMVQGNITAKIYNSSYSRQKSCFSSSCILSWNVPSELNPGNYNLSIKGSNEQNYYWNNSIILEDLIETKITSGIVDTSDIIINDYSASSEYYAPWNISISNTGNGKMSAIRAGYNAKSPALGDISFINNCPDLLPGESCNVSAIVQIPIQNLPGEYFVVFNVSWVDNDGSISGGAESGSIVPPGEAAFRNLIINGSSSFIVNPNQITSTMEHGNSRQLPFDIISTGSSPIGNINLSFISGNLLSQWTNINPNYISFISAAGSSSGILTINIPLQTSPGIYSGLLNISSANGLEQLIPVNITVPSNGSWYISPSANLSYNRSFSLNEGGEIGRYSLFNTGNIPLTFNINYNPFGTNNYIFYGVFSPNSGSSTLNPTRVLVNKGSVSQFYLNSTGFSTNLLDIGVGMTISNSSASPSSYQTALTFEIREQKPNVTDILFFVDGRRTSIAEQNRNLTIKIVATDDVNLDLSNTILNITDELGNSQIVQAYNIPSESVYASGGWRQANYTTNFTPQNLGIHRVNALVRDSPFGGIPSNLFVSKDYFFDSQSATNIIFNTNITDYIVSNVDALNSNKNNANFSLVNEGNVSAFDLNISFNKDSRIKINPESYSYNSLNPGRSLSRIFGVEVSELTSPGSYPVQSNLRYSLPDGTVILKQITFTITVLENKSMSVIPQLLSNTIGHGDSDSEIIKIRNTGNVPLINVNLECVSGDLCSNFTTSFNESFFNLVLNESRNVNTNFDVPQYHESGQYSGIINVSELNLSKLVYAEVLVPLSKTWEVSPLIINTRKVAGQSGYIERINITNTGNGQIDFTLSSSDYDIIQPNQSSISVSPGETQKVMINFTSPSEINSYLEDIMITSDTGIRKDVSVNLTTTNLNVNVISPNTLSPLSDVLAGQQINILTNVTFEGLRVDSGIDWNVFVGGAECTGLNYVFNSENGIWELSCNAPNVSDGLAHEISVELNHIDYGSISKNYDSSIIYRDISSPRVLRVYRNNVQINNPINLLVNISDNVEVVNIDASIIYPDGSASDVILSRLPNGLFGFSSLILNAPGEYNVNYVARDAYGNEVSFNGWFEVQDIYLWNLLLRDYSNNPVGGINISLYRPYTLDLLLNGKTNVAGILSLMVNKRFYDLDASFQNGEGLKVGNINLLDGNAFNLNFHKIADGDLVESVRNHKVFTGIASNSFNLDSNDVELRFNYTGLNYNSANSLDVVKCSDWNYPLRSCNSTWEPINSSVDRDNKIVTGFSKGFSAYFVAENTCGNGLCEISYLEDTSSCSLDCQTIPSVVSTSSGGGGGGGGGGASFSQSQISNIEKLLSGTFNVAGVKIETVSIYKEMFAGDSATFRITLQNTFETPNSLRLSSEGDVSQFIYFGNNNVELAPLESKELMIQIVIPKLTKPDNYEGSIVISSGSNEAKIPANVRVLPLEGKLLDVKIQPLVQRIAPGEILKLQTDILNLGKTKLVDIQFDVQLLDLVTGNVAARSEEAFAVETSLHQIKDFKVPESVKEGKYLIKAVAYYSSLEDKDQQASSISYITVGLPFWSKSILFIPFWGYLIIVLLIGGFIGSYYLMQYLDYRKKRFKVNVNFAKLPTSGSNSIFVGKVAESDKRAFMDLNRMQMHTLIAGATGGGKTVVAQDIVESALIKNKSVIIFDPTAQWTGFLRKCQDARMLNRYKYFEMDVNEARAFNGTIKTITNPYEFVDLQKYINRPGEITIFNVSRLTPQEIDILVASTVEQVFRSNPEESSELKTLIVYDEVHRLLPKFGGSGQGFVQLERGAREFRKWGIGLVLISQVLSDFIGEIKANIGTEIQMGTRYEGDLERVNVKYGGDALKSVVRAPIGTGMVVNAEYNEGKPYFVSFRPLLHNTKRLADNELQQYSFYVDRVEDLEYQLDRLIKYGVDVLDLKLELKLSRDKVKEGQFRIVDMYLESLIPKFESAWKSLRKKPEHPSKLIVDRKSVEQGINKALTERKKVAISNKGTSIADEIRDLKSKIETLKRNGKNTFYLEAKLKDFEERIKTMGNKISKDESENIKRELDSFRKEVGSN